MYLPVKMLHINAKNYGFGNRNSENDNFSRTSEESVGSRKVA